MRKNIQIIQSGIPLVDQAWGGFYRGGTYLLIGPHKSGRTLLGLQYALQAAKNKEICLYFTNMRPKDLMIHAASIDFDLQTYMNQNLIVLVRVAPPTDIYELKNPDEYLIEYLKDIITVVNQFSPNRIIFDELTPYIGFNNIELLRTSFLQTLETIEEKNITSTFVIGEPATPVAQSIVDVLAQNVTATIYLQKKGGREDLKNQGGKMIITPNIGHTEGQFSANYFIEPYKGIITDYKPTITRSMSDSLSRSNASMRTTTESKYQTLSNISVPASADSYSFTNFYELNDFLLILNNQIALYKSTGQKFHIVSFKLDPVAGQMGVLTVNQLQNAIRLATDKKDKICVQGNRIVVLITRSESKNVHNLIAKIQSNLPDAESPYIASAAEYISVLPVEIDESIENAESLMKYLSEDEDNADGGSDSYNRFTSI